ncbi:MAG: diguanylate cyclase [Lachnospiraceae bacterium]|nr:diguanylate cyclase [Lachnospiraceae bacterium]
MYYSCIGILALILHFIINREPLNKSRIVTIKDEAGKRVALRYRHFLLASVCYYISDGAWGVLYENHDIPALFPVIYSDTIFYFIFMFLTMLTWIRYIVAYLDKRRLRSKALLYSVWAMFTLGMLYLMINRFHPFIFYFNENHEYIPERGRYIAFILQIFVYMVTSTYMLYIARRTSGQERIRYYAVGLTSLVMELFQILQILYPLLPFYAMGLLIGTCVIHSFVEAGERKEKEIYDNIARSLAEDYEAMYYIDIETGEYSEFSTSKEYDTMNVPMIGRDFYAETRENAVRYAHPDDREFAKSLYYKETMLKNIEGRRSYSYKYRIMVGGEPRYFRFTVMRSGDGRHFVLYEKDIDDEITAESMRIESQKKNITFGRIAESLASNYDLIYYVDVSDGSYVSYESDHTYGLLETRNSGDDFYGETERNIQKIVHKNDRDRVAEFMNRDHMISEMGNRKRHSIDYRLSIEGKSQYYRMTVRNSSDGTHFIIGVENIDDEVRKEKQVLKALNTEKELARRDELTGTKNKTAYTELEKSVQANMDNGMDYLTFAIVVCDANNLKQINDNVGHVAGDEYIRESAKLLCDIFDHSPVFRVGGDEFVVFLRGGDYAIRDELMERLRSQVRANQMNESGPVLAAGMAVYTPETDSLVSEIFDRADRAMYEDKQSLKEEAERGR